jgi:hypothetical protein
MGSQVDILFYIYLTCLSSTLLVICVSSLVVIGQVGISVTYYHHMLMSL